MRTDATPLTHPHEDTAPDGRPRTAPTWTTTATRPGRTEHGGRAEVEPRFGSLVQLTIFDRVVIVAGVADVIEETVEPNNHIKSSRYSKSYMLKVIC